MISTQLGRYTDRNQKQHFYKAGFDKMPFHQIAFEYFKNQVSIVIKNAIYCQSGFRIY